MGLSFYIIAHFISGIISIFLGLLVILKNKKNAINIIFFLLTSSVAFWCFSYSIWLLMVDQEGALYWARMLNLGATFIPVLTLNWILLLLKKRRIKILTFFYSLTFFFAIFSFSSNYISGTKSILQFSFWPQVGWLYALFLALGWGLMLIYGFSCLMIELKNAKGLFKQQIKYVLFGLILGYLGGSTNYPLMFGFSWFPPYGSALVIAFPILFGYAIAKHRLMDIRVVLRAGSVYLVSLACLILPSLGIKFLINDYFSFTGGAVDFIILIIAISIFPVLRNYFYKVANKYFFTSLYDSQSLIADLSDDLGSTLDIGRIYEYISQSLMGAFHTKAIIFMSRDERTDEYEIRYRKGTRRLAPKSFVGNKAVDDFFYKKNKAVVMDEIKPWEFEKNRAVLELFQKWNIEVIVPFILKKKVTGLMLLTGKRSRDSYNDADLQVLNIVSDHSAMAVENATLYNKMLSFNERLREEVSKATKELRGANEKLKKLDVAKSEFVSIASHQLRTPLTIIKGYISMILENNFGDISEKQREPLERVFASNERLIQLVENLLNISRIESGRLTFTFEYVQFEDMVASVFEELSSQAKKKGVGFKYSAPDKQLPKIKLDREKIRQVIMNLTDNAIKYTQKGKVDVAIKKVGDNIEFCVSDDGMGISSDDIKKLFTKFTRGTDISLVHTEGTGLGLYVAKQMIESHHGRIWAESEGVGKGSRFCFELPIDGEKEAEPALAKS